MSTRRALLLAAFVGLLMAGALIALQRGGARHAGREDVPASRAALAQPDGDAASRPTPDGVAPTPAPRSDAPPAAALATSTLVDLHDVAPDVRVDLRYAGRGNFLHEPLYPANRCLLQRGTAERLARVQERLSTTRLVLVVWDCYRPLSIQQRMWDGVKDERHVANPKQDSTHNRAAAVDVTLAVAGGAALEMGSDYDDFSARALREFKDLSDDAIRHRTVLWHVMAGEGFVPLATEWWHFDDPDWADYPLLDEAIDAPRP